MKTITTPLYGYKLHLSIGDESAKIISTINRKIKTAKLGDDDIAAIKDTTSADVCCGYFLPLDIKGHGVLWLNKGISATDRADFIIISHEIIHACIGVFKYINSDVNGETEEPFCYLHDYLMEECLKEIEKRRDGNNTELQKPV